MSYQPHNWVSNEIIKASQLNHIEEGIANEYIRASQSESDIYEAIENETSRATQAEEGLGEVVSQNTSAITTLNGNSSTIGSVDYKIAQATSGGVTGVKGSAESSYRTGNVSISKSQIGLGNVENFLAVSTEANQGLTDTQKSNARANIGVSNFSGNYNDLTNKPTIPSATSQLNNDSGFISYKAVSTVANQGLSEIEKANARSNIGAGESGFSGDYNDLTNKPTKLSQFNNDMGYTSNTGTVTSVKVGSTSYNPSSGVVSLPAYPTDTNDAVAQTATTTSANYEVLFSGTADNSNHTEGARKNSNLTFNPSTGNLQTTQLNGVTIGNSPKFTDTRDFKLGTTRAGASDNTLYFVYTT